MKAGCSWLAAAGWRSLVVSLLAALYGEGGFMVKPRRLYGETAAAASPASQPASQPAAAASSRETTFGAAIKADASRWTTSS